MIGRSRAGAKIFYVRLTGFIAWYIRAFVHVALLIGYRDDFPVLSE